MKNLRTKADLEALEGTAREIASMIGPVFDQVGAGFALLGFELGEDGWSTYISNVRRDDMIRSMKEMIVSLEKDLDMPPIQGNEPEA